MDKKAMKNMFIDNMKRKEYKEVPRRYNMSEDLASDYINTIKVAFKDPERYPKYGDDENKHTRKHWVKAMFSEVKTWSALQCTIKTHKAQGGSSR